MCRFLKTIFLSLGVLLIIAALSALLSWRFALKTAAEYLYFSDAPVHADAIVAVSGERSRCQAAMDLYKQGFAPLLIFNVSDTTYYFGQPIDPVESVREDAARNGIPDSALVINRDIGSTWEDAHATRQTVRELALHSLIVVSSPFNMRRAALTYRKAFKADSLRFTFVSVPLEEEKISLDSWWTRERELILVNNEYLKLVLYYFKYFRPDSPPQP
jgi:uncharacterized SAM-binding protein YcdF (DUF218 family)